MSLSTLVLRAVATILAVAAVGVAAAWSGPTTPAWLVVGSALMLIPVCLVDWWAVAIGLFVHRQRPIVEVLKELDHMVRTALGGTIVAGLGASYLFGGLLPRGSGFMLLVAALLLFSSRPILFVFRYYRDR